MSETNPEQTERDLKGENGLESWTKTLGLLAVVGYVLGVITVAAYTDSLDVSSPSLDLFKTRYVLTGVVVLGAFLAPAAGAYWVWHLRRDESKWAHQALVAVIIGGFALAAFGVARSATFAPGFMTTRFALQLLALTGIAMTAGFLGYKWWHYSEEIAPGNGSVAVHTKRVIAGITICGLAATYAICFSHWVYPLVPEQFGGGEPTHAVLTFSEEGLVLASALGIELQDGENASAPLDLLYQDDSQYTVRYEKVGRRGGEGMYTAQISKSVVLGYSLDSRRPRAENLVVKSVEGHGIPTAVNDSIRFVYSERIKPESLLKDWGDEESRPAKLSLGEDPNRVGDYLLSVESGEQILNIGRVLIDGSNVPEIDNVKARLRFETNGFTLVLTERLWNPRSKWQPPIVKQMKWTPSPKAEDGHGNSADDRVSKLARVIPQGDLGSIGGG